MTMINDALRTMRRNCWLITCLQEVIVGMCEVQRGEYIRSTYWTGGRSGTNNKARGRGRGGEKPPSPSLYHSLSFAHTTTTACKQASWLNIIFSVTITFIEFKMTTESAALFSILPQYYRIPILYSDRLRKRSPKKDCWRRW